MLGKYLYYKNSAETYKTRLEIKEQYARQLEADVRTLRKNKLPESFDIESAKPDNTISKNINLINPYDYTPQTRYTDYNYSPQQTDKIIYFQTSKRGSVQVFTYLLTLPLRFFVLQAIYITIGLAMRDYCFTTARTL